jgi:alkylation response protein AidB-like acyl-CoA dehydrogenase
MSAASSSYGEREALRESLRAFFAKYSTETEVRRLMATPEGYDPPVWRRMAGDLGLQGFAVPTEYGGSGFGAAELQIVMEEMGRALLCAPFFSSAVLATNVLLSADDADACGDVLPGLCDGSKIATVAATADSGAWDGADVWQATAVPARRQSPAADATDTTDTMDVTGETAPVGGGGWAVAGRKTFVTDALAADLLLVTAQSSQGPSLFLVEAADPGVSRSPLVTLDETRKQGTVELTAAPARLIGAAGQGADILERALVLSATALAGEQVGGARRALELAVEYAKVRQQFGRVIGSFQAIKQKCADVLLAVEAATSAARAAAQAIDLRSDEYVALAHLALSLATEAYVYAVHENIEVHGGIGFTWEASAHLYYKRAIAGTALLGSPAIQRAALLTAMGR